MSFFTGSDQFYELTQALFDRVQQEDNKAAEALNKAKLLIRFNCREPEAVITINGRRVPAVITYGDNKIRPEVDVRLTADTFHHILLGDLRLGKAMSSHKIEVRGPAHKALAVAGLFHECQSIYPQILLEHGLQM
jgi:hypothetical protein